MQNKVVNTIISASALSSLAIAGPFETPTIEATSVKDAPKLSSSSPASSFEDLLKNGGTFYKNSDNPYIQKAKIYGRVQIQGGTVLTDGEEFGFAELRRTRVGAEIQFFQHFKWKGNADLENGSVNDIELDEFTGFDDAGISADLVSLFNINGFDKLSLTAGKKKIKIGADVHTSSTKIKTVERTRWTDNGLRPDNSTGFLLNGKTSGVSFAAGVFANADDSGFNFWQDGDASFAYGSVQFGAGPGDIVIDGIFTFGDEDQENLATSNDYAWSVAYLTEIAGWETEFNVGGAQDFDGDNLFGASILGSKNITEKLEFVGRLSYATGDHSALDSSSRNAREDDVVGGERDLVNGDNAFNAYVGLNYYFIGHNSKILLGVEYDHVSDADNVEGNEDAFTLSAAYRLRF